MKDQINSLFHYFVNNAREMPTSRWQGMDVSERPDMRMLEVLHRFLIFNMTSRDLSVYQEQIGPNLPWADNHFELERVSGEPINPGTTWKQWPYGHAAERALDDNGQFNHSYAERYWPRYAGMTYQGALIREDLISLSPHFGIRNTYGDLAGVVRLLVGDPLTRQAYLPVWFPEDTGDAHNGRKPCTIGYHFIMRSGKLDISYHIRSCDIVRHFRDDVYLTVRLVLWILDECAKIDGLWRRVVPGQFNMMIGSLHCFVNDMPAFMEKYS